jgi:hypothetical protein
MAFNDELLGREGPCRGCGRQIIARLPSPSERYLASIRSACWTIAIILIVLVALYVLGLVLASIAAEHARYRF